jgi:hypothetical protein
MTKRVVLAFALTGIGLSLQAQTIDDALRFSTTAPGGTTRGQSVGGATGALGGDVSSIYINPAGVGFFRTSDFSFTVGLGNISNKGTYLGMTDKDNKTVPSIANATMIFGGKRKRPDSKWQNFSFGFGFNRNSSFNERVYYTGNNNQSSLSLNYYLQADAAGITNPDLQLGGSNSIGYLAHSAVLAYQTYLINPYYDDNNNFNGNFTSAAEADDYSVNVRQEKILNSKGSSNDLSFAFGANYNDMLYLGGSLNFPFISYERENTWKETNINSVYAELNNFAVSEYVKTDGNGFNAKLGAIIKPIRPLNIGLSFHTPSWLTFTETYQTDMTTSTKAHGVQRFSSTDTNEGFMDESKYTVRTPWKGIVSATYLFSPSADTRRPTGFITVDYEYMDYASMKMRFKNGQSTDMDDTRSRNAAIKSTYQGASNIRVGGELKLHVVALRLGYATYGNPYKDSKIDGSRQYYTGGIGYRNKGFYMDFGLVYGTGTRQDQPYVMEPNNENYVNPIAAEIKTTNTNFVTTFGWKF